MSTPAMDRKTDGNRPANQTILLAERICAISSKSLDDVTVSTVKSLIADGVAVAVAGSRECAPAIVAEHVRGLACGAQSTVWGYGFKTAPQLAAYANAVSMHVLDFEPMSSPPTHAVSPTVPVALALGESLGANGREIIAACAKGFEMQGRLLLGSGHSRGELPFHTPGVVGLMGSAVTAAHLLGLDATQLAHALGAAASRCSGLPANTGSMVKCTHCGNAAQAGLEAALLAQRGFTAHPSIFEAECGYVETFFPKHFDYDVMHAFGRPYRCVEPGMAIKFFPSKYPTHFAIAAALDVRRAIPDPRAIRAVRLLTPEITDADRPRPRSGLEGKFSFQYVTAVSLIEGRIGIDSFTDEIRFRDDVVELLNKVRVVRDPARSQDTRNMYVDIEVEVDDAVHMRRCSAPPGTWGRPVDAEQHRAKLATCLAMRLNASERDRVLELFERFDALDASGIGELMALLE